MTVDATIPTGETLGSELPDIIQENREQINLLWAAVGAVGGAATYEAKSLVGGTTDLELVGAGLIHTIALGAAVPVSLTDISDGVEGQLLLIKATGANVTFVHNNSKIHLSGEVDYNMAANDFLLLLNEGGSTGVDGTWIEFLRTVHV